MLVDDLSAGNLQTTAQDPSAPHRTFSRHDRPDAMAMLDWRRPAVELDRLVRALTFGPYPNPLGVAKLLAGGEAVAVTTVALPADEDDTVAAPGTIVEITDDAVRIATSQGTLSLSGFSSLRGAELGVADVVERLGLVEGQQLPLLTDADAATLDELGHVLARQEAGHLRHLSQLEPVELPWASTPPAQHVTRHAVRPLEVPAALRDDEGAVVAAFAVVLSRLVGKDRFHLALFDDAWGSRTAGASSLLADAVPFEVDVRAEERLDEVRADIAAALGAAKERLPFANELIARHPDLVRNPDLVAGRLLPISVALGAPSPTIDGVVVELCHRDGAWEIRHDEALVAAEDADLLAACISTVLDAVADGGDPPAAEVDLLGPTLRHRVLVDWNDTEAPLPSTTVHELIEARADLTPDVTAVVFEDSSITYAELDERANRLAHHLIELGTGPDSLVGVHVSRGIDLVVAAVAVHKAGGAYVPLDPVYPANRLEHMISDSGCAVVITESPQLPTLPLRDDPRITVVVLDTDAARIAQRPSTRPGVAVDPANLAYCIYTSGSTGLPKGVLVEHRNVVNFFVGMDERVPHDLPATWFAVTSLSFDISVLELLYTLTRGLLGRRLPRPRPGRRRRGPVLRRAAPRGADRLLALLLLGRRRRGRRPRQVPTAARGREVRRRPRLRSGLDPRTALPRVRRPLPAARGDQCRGRGDHLERQGARRFGRHAPRTPDPRGRGVEHRRQPLQRTRRHLGRVRLAAQRLRAAARELQDRQAGDVRRHRAGPATLAR